jgi:hypothetical protein
MKKYYFVFLCCILSFLNAVSQQQPLQLKWLNTAQLYLNGGDFVAESVTSSPDGSTVVVGYFNHTVDFDPGPDSFNLTAVSRYDIFIAKYSDKGALLFAYGFGGGSSQFQSANSVAADANGNAYVTGSFSGDVDFDPGTGKAILSSPMSSTNNFLVCFGKNGKLKFAKNITATTDSDRYQYANSIVLDKNKNIYVGGSFWATSVDFDPGINNTALKGIKKDIFFAKYDSLGNFVFVKTMGGTSFDEVNKIALDKNNNILICGDFESGAIDFDPDTSSHILSLKGKQDLFFAKYDANGNFIFAKNIGGTASDNANAIAIGTDNNFVITGYFSGKSIDFDPGNGKHHLLTSNGNIDAFIVKYDTGGNCVFAFNIGSSSSNDLGKDLGLDSNNNIICTGSFSGNTVDFDPGKDTFQIKNSAYGYNFIATYTYDGDFLLAGAIGNEDQLTNSYSDINCLHVTATGNILLGGYYNHNIDADAGLDHTILYSPSSTMVVYKYDNKGQFINVINTNNYFNYYNASSTIASSALDKEGNVYVAGAFNGRFDFDPGPGTYLLESLDDYKASGFFAKYSRSGKLIFAKALIGGSVIINDIAVDGNENVYLTGYGNSTTDFDPTDSVQQLYNGDSTYAKYSYGYFYAKYNNTGELVFAKGEGHSYGIDFTSIAVDQLKNIYLAGHFNGSLDFDPGPDHHSLNAGSSYSIFFSKYDSSGNFIYVKSMQSSAGTYSTPTDLKLNSKNEIVITGDVSGQNIDFDPGPQTYFLSSFGGTTAGFISTYKNNGSFISAFSVGTTKTGLTNFYSINLDNRDNIYVSGFSTGDADFDPGAATVTLPGLQGMCFASYTNKNKLRFLKGISSYNNYDFYNNGLTTISLDKSGNIYVAGNFESQNIDCDPGPDTALLVNEHYNSDSYSSNEIFLAKYDSAGNYIYSYNFDGDSAVGYNHSVAIMIDGDGNVDYSGFATTKLNFSTGAKKVYLQPTSLSFNIFVAQYKPTTTQSKNFNSLTTTKNVLDKQVKVYPNPIKDYLNIQLSNINQNNATAIIGLYDANGKQLQANKATFSNHNLNTTIRLPQNLSSGNYFIGIEVEGKTYYSDVLIK